MGDFYLKIVLLMNLSSIRCSCFLLKLISVFLIVVIVALSVKTCAAQSSTNYDKLAGKWNVSLVHNSIGEVQFLMDFKTNEDTFEAYSRKHADRDILGSWKSLMARTFSDNFKNGSLLRIENGDFQNSNDTIYLKGELVSTIGNLKLEGYIVDEKLESKLKYNNGEIAGKISANHRVSDFTVKNYHHLLKDIQAVTKKNIFKRDVLKSKEWMKFIHKMESSSQKFVDDLDMIFAFYYHSRNLPFSHFSLVKNLDLSKNQIPEPIKKRHLTLKQKNAEIAYLKISSFIGTSVEVDSIFKIISEKEYEHLIVDLRNNSGGNVEAGITFASNVLDTISYGGVFLTQKWFNNHSGLPQIEDYIKFAYFSEANNNLLLEDIHEREGLCLKVIPKKNPYIGKLYVLVNKNTASTCEPIIYELKKQKRAVIIGETTAGAMLSSETFSLDSGYKITIPTADYYTSDGYRIDQNGVKPNIKTNNNDALQTAFEIITNLENN